MRLTKISEDFIRRVLGDLSDTQYYVGILVYYNIDSGQMSSYAEYKVLNFSVRTRM